MAQPARVRSILAAAVVVPVCVTSTSALSIAFSAPTAETGLISLIPAPGVLPSWSGFRSRTTPRRCKE